MAHVAAGRAGMLAAYRRRVRLIVAMRRCMR